jgi:hypothetical protein
MLRHTLDCLYFVERPKLTSFLLNWRGKEEIQEGALILASAKAEVWERYKIGRGTNLKHVNVYMVTRRNRYPILYRLTRNTCYGNANVGTIRSGR